MLSGVDIVGISVAPIVVYVVVAIALSDGLTRHGGLTTSAQPPRL
jgi:hypothetical protein